MIIEYVQIVLLALIVILLSVNGIKTMPTVRRVKMTIIDSCGLIDGRITELIQAGFINGKIVIPQFVLRELQMLADGNDSQKRERARFGLDVAKELLENKTIDARLDKTNPSVRTTDEKLLVLAKKQKAMLYTTDFNLNKRAAAEGVTVLNINELAQTLRPVALPGEIKEIKIIERGSSKDQGVGYLDDGTMVVVDHAAKYKGKRVKVTVSRSLQTVAGKMMFASITPQPHKD